MELTKEEEKFIEVRRMKRQHFQRIDDLEQQRDVLQQEIKENLIAIDELDKGLERVA